MKWLTSRNQGMRWKLRRRRIKERSWLTTVEDDVIKTNRHITRQKKNYLGTAPGKILGGKKKNKQRRNFVDFQCSTQRQRFALSQTHTRAFRLSFPPLPPLLLNKKKWQKIICSDSNANYLETFVRYRENFATKPEPITRGRRNLENNSNQVFTREWRNNENKNK